MKTKNKIYRLLGILFLSFILTLLVAPDIAEAKGSRRSFGGSRSFRSKSYSSKPSRSRAFSKNRSSSSPKMSRSSMKKSPSFGGSRMSRRDAFKKYGAPRKTIQKTGTSAYGGYQNYRYHSYDGFGSGLMSGYMMGAVASHMMWTPWSSYYWYTRPTYANSISDETKIRWHVTGGSIVGPSDEASVDIKWNDSDSVGQVTVVLTSPDGKTEQAQTNVKILPKGSSVKQMNETEKEVTSPEEDKASITGPAEVVAGSKQVYSTGTIDVFPPEFNIWKAVLTIIVIIVVIYIIYAIFFKKKKKSVKYSRSSFS